MKPPSSHKAGIYRILCLNSGKYYLGSSNNCYKRWSTHWSALRANRHQNRHLQFAFNKYGKDAFVFEVLEEVENLDSLLEIEQEFIDQAPKDLLLNCSFRANATMLGKQHSSKAKAKIAARSKGKRNPMYGKKHTKESLAKMSGANNHGAKLNWNIVRAIREMRAKGMLFREIALATGIYYNTVRDVANNVTWNIDQGE